MRPARLLAVARRDLAAELGGRRGLALPVVFGLVLLPIAVIPRAEQALTTSDPPVYVTGDLPPAVAAMPNLRVGPNPIAVHFAVVDGVVHARGPFIPDALRKTLDRDDPAAVALEVTVPDFYWPYRTFFLALLTSSILVGAVSEALPGERARKTLETLLTAGITRLELIAGKVLAWGGIGAIGTLVAAAITVSLGRMPAGLWVFPLPLVPLCTVAVGFWSVRRAQDVIGASTVTVRIVPAILGGLGLLAWGLGIANPVAGAAIPLGGALFAAGGSWPGFAPPLVATLSTGVTTAVLVLLTARELDSDPIGREAAPTPSYAALGYCALALMAHWGAVLGPILWGLAGNVGLANGLLPGPGVFASGIAMLLFVVIAVARASDPFDALQLRRPVPSDALAVLLGTLGVAAARFVSISPAGVTWEDVARRTGEGVFPSTIGLVLLTAVAQELLFRGAVQRLGGPIAAAVASTLILCPVDPVRGLVLAATLGAVTYATKNAANAVAARVLGSLLVLLA